MTTFIIVVHMIVCIALIGIVLIQRGRGSGLVESFAGVESMFGTKTSAFLTRATTVCSILFFCTCLSLAVLSFRQSRSLMRNIKPTKIQAEPQTSSGQELPTPSLPETKATDAPQ
jgi:preprotein translocase subunit SecG